MRRLYNDIEPYPCQWVGNLVRGGMLPAGDVICGDFREIAEDVIAGHQQIHWFAGIGGWAHALRLAGYENMPCWTASLPCQPFSNAGKRLGESDERHLWPAFRGFVDLIRSPVIFGEQVASPAGRLWLAGVRSDLEALGYAVGAADLCAAGVGAPHIRQRLYWGASRLGHAYGAGSQGWGVRSGERANQQPAGQASTPSGLVHAVRSRVRNIESGRDGSAEDSDQAEGAERKRVRTDERPGHAGASFWDDCDIIHCRDGKSRRTGPGLFPLAHGVSKRASKLRAYGNPIVPQVAAEFVASFMESAEGLEKYDAR